MKIYVPLNLTQETDSRIYGWIDRLTGDIFICSFLKPMWFQEFTEIGIEKCVELGKLSGSNKKEYFRLQNSSNYLYLHSSCYNDNNSNNNNNDSVSTVIIYYQVHREFSKSADFSNIFSTSPLKLIKWASIVNYNNNGQFLKLTIFQKLLSSLVSNFINLKSVHQCTSFLCSSDYFFLVRRVTKYSSCFEQIFKKKKNLEEMYKYLLLNGLSDFGRNRYRNNLILTVTDMFLGSFILPIILNLSLQTIGQFLTKFTLSFFEEYLDWFMGWPAGFKFNANLTKFFGRFFLTLFAIWKVFKINNNSADPFLNFKFFGFSLIIGLISDFWSAATFHIFFFYRLMTKIYQFYFILMVSLFRLFRGKKWNSLRNRVDQTEYTMDQLLVGMLLFSMLFCTFPTVIAYYWLFLSTYLFSLSVKCFLETISIILNNFPIYHLLLKLIRSPTLTERIKLIPCQLNTRTPSFIIRLETKSLVSIFSHLINQIINCWTGIINLKNIYNILIGLPINNEKVKDK